MVGKVVIWWEGLWTRECSGNSPEKVISLRGKKKSYNRVSL